MRLRDIREDRNLTQQEIADLLNVKQNTYQQYESGKRQLPLQSLVKLCSYYNLSADYILGFDRQLPFPER